jgi:hypothetical protein
MAQEASFPKQAEQAIKTIFALTTRLSTILDALEYPKSDAPPQSPWPLRVAIVAIGLAIASFFTQLH